MPSPNSRSGFAGPIWQIKHFRDLRPLLQFWWPSDPKIQFNVEVDASSTRIGVVLSQEAEEGRIYPCAFFSKKLSAAE